MITLAYILSGLSILMSVLLLIQTKNPLGWIALFPKITAEALSPIWAIIGVIGALIGWAYDALWAVPMGFLGTGMMTCYIWQCTRDHKGFDKAFGTGWKDQIPAERSGQMVKRRWTWFLKMEAPSEPSWERDVPIRTIPGTDQQLLCDIWHPSGGNTSGLALIYLHGGGWAAFDKDFGTRPFFRHLVAQGHTVMDVAYRLIPEVDIHGMVGDVNHAIAWMKANASRYGVDPEKIVLGGASAGGHLALMAGYTSGCPEWMQDERKGSDLSVCGVISYYGPTDLFAVYQHMDLKRIEGQPEVPTHGNLNPNQRLQYAGRLDILLGGWPQDAPDMYQMASPVTHVHPGCPPTLLMQGKLDFVTSVDATCALHTKLVENGVPAVNVVFPWTDHAFDLLLPQINPAAQSALYDVDRFLALLASKKWRDHLNIIKDT